MSKQPDAANTTAEQRQQVAVRLAQEMCARKWHYTDDSLYRSEHDIYQKYRKGILSDPNFNSKIQPEPKKIIKKMSLAALILGAVGMFISGLGYLGGMAGLICAVLAIIFGIRSLNKAKKDGEQDRQAKIGIILGIVGVVIFVIASIVFSLVILGSGAFNELINNTTPVSSFPY